MGSAAWRASLRPAPAPQAGPRDRLAPGGRPGIPICGHCLFAIQALPLGCLNSGGRLLLEGRFAADDAGLAAFRAHAENLNLAAAASGTRIVALDGKVLKGSFDAFNDVKAKQILGALAADSALVLAHIEIDEKSNEIPAAQKFLGELGLAGCIVTLDALHCQKTTARMILDKDGEYFLQIKANQKHLNQRDQLSVRQFKLAIRSRAIVRSASNTGTPLPVSSTPISLSFGMASSNCSAR